MPLDSFDLADRFVRTEGVEKVEREATDRGKPKRKKDICFQQMSFPSFWKGRLKSIFLNKTKNAAHRAATNRSPTHWVRFGEEEQGSGRMTFFSPVGIKERRSKADFAPTWKGRLKSILSTGPQRRPTGLLAGGAFAPYERFAAGKTSAQGEFTSPKHFYHRRVEPPFGRRNPKKGRHLLKAGVFLFWYG